MRDASINSKMHRCTKNCLAGRTIATQTEGFTSTKESQESYTARHLYLPDTHAALYADNWCSYGASSSPTNTRSQVTSRSTSEIGMIGLHDHTGSNNHYCVFTHPCPSSYGHGFSNIASLAQSYRAAQRFTHWMCSFIAN